MDKLTFYAPIEKTDEEQRMVYGYASTEALDSQGEIVKKDALKSAITDYMKFANIREMHQPSAVGKTKKANIDAKGLYIAAKVVDDNAWKKVKEGVYNGFSIGGRVKTQIDNQITGLSLSEISLVDRPANPEAVFDVFKADTVEETPKKKKKTVKAYEMPDMSKVTKLEGEKLQKCMSTVAEMAMLIERLNYIAKHEELEAQYEEDNSPIPAKLKADLDGLIATFKSMVEEETTELVEEEDEEEIVEMAEKTKDLKKEDTTQAEDKKEDVPPVETVEKPVETITEPAKAEEKPENEPVKESAEKGIDLQKIDEKISSGVMPNDEELTALLKMNEIDVNDKNIGILRYNLAGKIIEHIEKSLKSQADKDATELAMKKEQEKVEVTKEEVPHQFDEVKLLVRKLEKQMSENAGTPLDVEKPPASVESPTSPAETVSTALAALQEAVKALSAVNTGNQLTDEEKRLLMDGVKRVSEVTSTGRFRPEAENKEGTISQMPAKTVSEEPTDMKKFQSEIEDLRSQVMKLANMPMPVTVRAAYSVVEKFESGDTKKLELEKAEKRSEELQKLLAIPHDKAIETEAANLSLTIMRLRREVNGSN